MNSFLRFLPVVVLIFLAAFLSQGVFAQGLSDNNYSNPQPFMQDGTNNLTAPIATTTGSSAFNLDWRWVLPLLLVGVGLLFLRGSRERVDRSYYNPSRDYTVAFHDIDGERRRKRKQIRRLKRPLKAA